MKTLGINIRKKREELGMTQQELADKLGYASKSTINKIENGTNDITQSKIIAFAKALNTTVPELMGWSNNAKDLKKTIEEYNPEGDRERLRMVFSEFENGIISKEVRDQLLKELLPLDSVFYDKNNDEFSIPGNIYMITHKKQIPVLGTIAAGQPIIAEEQVEYLVANESDIEAHFALKIKGDSMIGARIHDGDIVFIRQQPDVEDGEIAAVLIDGEATLKRVYKMPGRVQLRAENPKYEPRDFTDKNCDDFKILGKAVGFQSRL